LAGQRSFFFARTTYFFFGRTTYIGRTALIYSLAGFFGSRTALILFFFFGRTPPSSVRGSGQLIYFRVADV